MRWHGVDHGRESLLKLNNWTAVLEILAQHEGVDHRDTNSALYADLSDAIPSVTWVGQGGRSFFRDYRKPWIDAGVVVVRDDSTISLTDHGRSIANNPELAVDYFRDYIDNYIELWDINGARYHLSPFEIIARVLTSGQIEDVSVLMSQSEIAAIKSLPMGISDEFRSGDTPRRRFRSYLTLLQNIGVVSLEAGGGITVLDIGYLKSLIRSEEEGELQVLDRIDSDWNIDEDSRMFRNQRSVYRENQNQFAAKVFEAYEGRCCVTGSRQREVLQCAHIVRYLGRKSSTVNNGLLLAVDIHVLYDRFLLGIDPDSHRIELASEVHDPRYTGLAGTKLTLPIEPAYLPDRRALDRQFQLFWARGRSVD